MRIEKIEKNYYASNNFVYQYYSIIYQLKAFPIKNMNSKIEMDSRKGFPFYENEFLSFRRLNFTNANIKNRKHNQWSSQNQKLMS